MTQVELYGTTLRDGAQYEGISLSVEDKLTITDRLDQLGSTTSREAGPAPIPKTPNFSSGPKTSSSRTPL